MGGEVNSIIAQDSLLFIGANTYVAIYSITEPTNPVRLGTFSTEGPTYVGAEANYLYAGDDRAHEVKIIDNSAPLSPHQVDSVSIDVLGLLAKDNFLYVATDTGLALVSVVNPIAPQIVGATRTSGGRSTGVRLA